MVFSTFALLASSLSFSSVTGISQSLTSLVPQMVSYTVSGDFQDLDTYRDDIKLISTYTEDNITYTQTMAKLYFDYDSVNDSLSIGFSKSGWSCNVEYLLDITVSYTYNIPFHLPINCYPLTHDELLYNTIIPLSNLPGRSPDDQFTITLNLQIFYIDGDFYQRFILSPDADVTVSYDNGFTAGYNHGQYDGYHEGFTEGQTTGYNTGYEVGYTDGQTDYANTHDYSFTNLFYAIGDTPILYLRRLFGFELFGLNVMSIFMSLFTFIIVIHIIKKVF